MPVIESQRTAQHAHRGREIGEARKTFYNDRNNSMAVKIFLLKLMYYMYYIYVFHRPHLVFLKSNRPSMI